ncbi:MAG: PIN domain-containing protein [Sedimentisphaerales bacterium]|nr:PIN domain-containing protein [Sedimentisphaerales bacterium]
MAKKRIIYWDSDCFLGLLNKEVDKIEKCKGTIQAAENNTLIIVISAITIAEVIRLKKKPHLTQASEKTISDFFKNDFISVINVDRRIASKARQLMWKYSALQPKDSIHVATAILQKIDTLNTFDEGLIKLDNQLGNPALHICYPDIAYQQEFEFPEDE